MAERSDIADKIIEITAKQVGKPKDDLMLEMHFVNDVGCDSLDVIEIVMQIEDVYGIKIPEDEGKAIQTIADAVKYVESKVSAKLGA
jgi:acyl carrier protein